VPNRCARPKTVFTARWFGPNRVPAGQDFGATDAFLTEEEMANATGEILHLPTCVGAVAVIYNLPGAYALRLTPEVLSLMLSGGIKRWTDARIGAGNDGAVLPDLEITVVHRSDASGTTFILSDYLSRVDPAWRDAIGSGTLIRWPVGIGVEKNQGVARTVAKIPGSIGYVEFTYAKKHALAMALIRNKSGNYILPDIDAASKAAVITIPADTRVMITNTDDPHGYPISAFTWLIFTGNRPTGHGIPNAREPWRIFSGGSSTTVSDTTRRYIMLPCRNRWCARLKILSVRLPSTRNPLFLIPPADVLKLVQ
jgi:phosphate ABC transporter phosphate-binding protein